jgi:propionyl-CoA synthetase
MPMVPETLIAMLLRRGSGRSSDGVRRFCRQRACRSHRRRKPKVVVSPSAAEPGRIVNQVLLLDAAIKIAANKPELCIILQRQMAQAPCQGARLRLAELVAEAKSAGRKEPCVPVEATAPLYILYTSGTTGQPKGVVRDNGGHMVALKWSMKNIYDVKPGEVYWAASDIGWVVGHSYIVYAPLLNGNTTVIYEGKPVGTPDAGAFWRVISEHKVAALFTAPTALRAIKRDDSQGNFIGKYDLSSLRTLFLAGERADPDTIMWAEEHLGIPVIDHWWQTETGWAIAGNPVGLGQLPVKRGSATVAMPGFDVRVLDDAGHPVESGKLGNIVVKLPLPPSCLPTLWHADERFAPAISTNFPVTTRRLMQATATRMAIFCHGPHGRRDQRAGHRPPPAPWRKFSPPHKDVAECRGRRLRHLEGRGAGRLSRRQIRRRAGFGANREGSRRARAREDRAGRRLQDRGRGFPPAEDPLGQDPAQHDQEDRRRPELRHARDA